MPGGKYDIPELYPRVYQSRKTDGSSCVYEYVPEGSRSTVPSCNDMKIPDSTQYFVILMILGLFRYSAFVGWDGEYLNVNSVSEPPYVNSTLESVLHKYKESK